MPAIQGEVSAMAQAEHSKVRPNWSQRRFQDARSALFGRRATGSALEPGYILATSWLEPRYIPARSWPRPGNIRPTTQP
jgi:hypothetical protein